MAPAPVTGSPADRFVYTDITDPRARPLFEDLSHEYSSRYGGDHSLDPDSVEMRRYPPILFRPPRGGFLLLMRGNEAIAGGAFMPIDARTAELKRIWTRADVRRQGLSTLVLSQLEVEVARRGFSRIYLTTGNRQPEARNLYLKAGYVPLFDVDAPAETVDLWPFEKAIIPIQPYGEAHLGIRARVAAWQQERALERAWTLRKPILRRLDADTATEPNTRRSGDDTQHSTTARVSPSSGD